MNIVLSELNSDSWLCDEIRLQMHFAVNKEGEYKVMYDDMSEASDSDSYNSNMRNLIFDFCNDTSKFEIFHVDGIGGANGNGGSMPWEQCDDGYQYWHSYAIKPKGEDRIVMISVYNPKYPDPNMPSISQCKIKFHPLDMFATPFGSVDNFYIEDRRLINQQFTPMEKTIIRSSSTFDSYISFNAGQSGNYTYLKEKDSGKINVIHNLYITHAYMNDIANASVGYKHGATDIREKDNRICYSILDPEIINNGEEKGEDGKYHLQISCKIAYTENSCMLFDYAFDDSVKAKAEAGEDVKEARRGFHVTKVNLGKYHDYDREELLQKMK